MVSALIHACLVVAFTLWTCFSAPLVLAPAWADSKDQPAATHKPPVKEQPKSGKPASQVEEIRDSLNKTGDQLGHETSKAVRSMKDFFKKRFNTTSEEKPEKK